MFTLLIMSCDSTNVTVDERGFNYTAKPRDGFVDPICTAKGQYIQLSTPRNKIQENLEKDETFQNYLKSELEHLPHIIKPALFSYESISLSGSNQSLSNQHLGQNKEIIKINLTIDEIPVCNYIATIQKSKRGTVTRISTPYHLQNKVDHLSNYSHVEKWPNIKKTSHIILDEINKKLSSDKTINFSDLEILESSKCIGLDSVGDPKPFWKLSFTIKDREYYTVANEMGILNAECGLALYPKSYQATGSGRIFQVDSSGSNYALSSIQLENISASKYLCNEKFVVENAYSETQDFSFSQDSKEIHEVTLFYNAVWHANWLINLLPDQIWIGSQIMLYVETDDANRAEYISNKNEYRPSIHIGYGNGSLQNLTIDRDVIAHEVGHHIISQNIKVPFCQGKILHEGIADYLVQAHNNNSCLAKTSCPSGGSFCDYDSNNKLCLRNANNTFKISDYSLSDDNIHTPSQVISGLLWDYGKLIGHSQSTKTLTLALKSMSDSTGFLDFVYWLIEADKDINGGNNSCWIRNSAVERELVESGVLKC